MLCVHCERGAVEAAATDPRRGDSEVAIRVSAWLDFEEFLAINGGNERFGTESPSMKRRKNARVLTPVRFNAARVDATVGSIRRRIERDYKLPEGSVALMLVTKKPARSDKKIGELLRHWGW